jgi:hypothetical protein
MFLLSDACVSPHAFSPLRIPTSSFPSTLRPILDASCFGMADTSVGQCEQTWRAITITTPFLLQDPKGAADRACLVTPAAQMPLACASPVSGYEQPQPHLGGGAKAAGIPWWVISKHVSMTNQHTTDRSLFSIPCSDVQAPGLSSRMKFCASAFSIGISCPRMI